MLKRLEDAEADGDFVWGVITGTSVTNDGRQKSAYTAPSAHAQAVAVVSALSDAGRTAEEVNTNETK